MKHYFLALLLFAFSFSAFSQQDSIIDIEDGVLSYRIFGTGEPILFLNGGPGFASNGYEAYARILAKKRQVILFDQRGNGKSKLVKLNIKTVNVRKMIADIETLRNHLKIKEWEVMGNSFGVFYAMAYATKHPERIKKMILSSSVGVDWKSVKKIPTLKKVDTSKMLLVEKEIAIEYDSLKKKNKKEYAPKITQLGLGLIARNYVYKEESIPKAVDWFVYQAQYNRTVAFLVHNNMGRYNFKSKLKKFTKPVLIIHATADFIPITIHKKTVETFPNAELKTVQECGHMIFMDQPDIYKQTLYDFLE